MNVSPRPLSGRVAVVTGSDSGIGAAVARAFAAAGADVAVSYLHDAAGADGTRTAVEAAGARAFVRRLDVRDEEDIEAYFDAARAALGDATLLVNSAGIDAGGIAVREMTLDAWNAALEANLTGPFLCTRAFLRRLPPRDETQHGVRAKIVNVTSVHEEQPRSGASEYCASKGGLRNLTRCLALELAPDCVTAVNVAPGMVLTPMNQKDLDDPEQLAKDEATIPLRRAAKPEEVAGLVLWLASPAGDYATGTSFTLEGGLMQNTGQGA
ncbi:MAG: SDR family oxidoreductase [Candidatus Eremiobacteraeota bacterium]|nr:SDR family oxidoreductase [Candidatus Eremiobacteraeota bacterium]